MLTSYIAIAETDIDEKLMSLSQQHNLFCLVITNRIG